MPKTKTEIQRDYEKRSGYAAQEKYNREKTMTVNLRLVKSTEADIIEKLMSEPNKSGYIKRLIREDIAKSKE